MGFAIEAYRRQVEDFLALMREGAGLADVKLGPGKWTLKEMVGHLAATAREDCYGHVWASAEGDKRLDFLIPDYFAHLELHRRMFAERLEELRSAAG